MGPNGRDEAGLSGRFNTGRKPWVLPEQPCAMYPSYPCCCCISMNYEVVKGMIDQEVRESGYEYTSSALSKQVSSQQNN